MPRQSTTNITIGNETRSLSEWARLAGLDPKIVRSRLSYGWEPYEAVWEPLCFTPRRRTTDLMREPVMLKPAPYQPPPFRPCVGGFRSFSIKALDVLRRSA